MSMRDQFSEFSIDVDFPKAAEDELFASLTEISAKISRQKFAVSLDDIENIQTAKHKALELVERHFTNMQRTALQRRETLSLGLEANFVSIGSDCFPRTVLTRWGFKKTAKMGEPTLPFDLAIHPLAAVRALLAEDFKQYFDGSLIIDPVKGYAVNTELGIELNHEKDPAFFENGKLELLSRYHRRVSNFKDVMSDTKPAICVVHMDEPQIALLKDVATLIKARREGKETYVVAIYTPRPGLTPAPTALCGAEDIIIIVEPYPFPKYTWYRQRHTFTLRGVNFEKTVADKLLKIVDDLDIRRTRHSRTKSSCSSGGVS